MTRLCRKFTSRTLGSWSYFNGLRLLEAETRNIFPEEVNVRSANESILSREETRQKTYL